jgi:CheY-like chemotaxis protein
MPDRPDGEDLTRGMIAVYLEQNGFRVVAASSVREALHRCEQMDAAQIDLPLTNFVMPGP